MSISMRRRLSLSKRRRPSGKANGSEASAGRARLVGPSERCPADLIVERAGATNEPKGMPRHAARPRPLQRPSAAANMSRLLRAEIAADAATTRKRVERSATHDRKGRTIAVERMSRAVEEAPAAAETRPKRAGRSNTGEEADIGLKAAPAPVGASPSGPSEAEPPEGAKAAAFGPYGGSGSAREVKRRRGLKAARASAASTALQREVMAIVEMVHHVRGAPAIRPASASLSGLRGGRVSQPERGGRLDRTERAAGHGPTSSQDRLAQERATEIGRRAAFATRAAMADRRANASLTGLRIGRAPSRRRPTAAIGRQERAALGLQIETPRAGARPRPPQSAGRGAGGDGAPRRERASRVHRRRGRRRSRARTQV